MKYGELDQMSLSNRGMPTKIYRTAGTRCQWRDVILSDLCEHVEPSKDLPWALYPYCHFEQFTMNLWSLTVLSSWACRRTTVMLERDVTMSSLLMNWCVCSRAAFLKLAFRYTEAYVLFSWQILRQAQKYQKNQGRNDTDSYRYSLFLPYNWIEHLDYFIEWQ